MADRELCIECANPTGRAGLYDDSLYLGDYGPYCEECYDDLIAAAPELVKALEALIGEATAALRCAFGDGPPGDRIWDNQVLVRARQALAKARGEDQ